MDRQIVVMSNCQTGGVTASLRAMLPDDHVEPVMWLGREPDELAELLTRTDVLVTSLDRATATAILDRHGVSPVLIVIPTLYFTGLHPDLSQFLLRGGGELQGIAGPYHSKIVVWGWLHGIPPEEILAYFNPATYVGLGYLDAWAGALAILRGQFDGTDVDFGAWYLRAVRHGSFMLTNNHPRLVSLVELARLVAERLGADADLVAYDWTLAIPDGLLATGVSWPIYPGVGAAIDLPGTYGWRLADGSIIGLERFVSASISTYYEADPSIVDHDHLLADPRFLAVLGDRRPTPTGGR
jgi:hypothetical protein